MIKLDISTSQLVWYKGNQATIRSISTSGREIGLQLETGGEFITVSPEELLEDNPDLVYDCYPGDEEAEDDPYGLMKWLREEEERGEFD